jgi:hypothetical protein
VSSEQVVAEMREELSHSHYAVEVSVQAFQSWIDRLSTPAAGGDAGVVIARLNASMSNPSMIGENLAAAEMVQQAVATIRQLQARNAEQALQLRFLLSERERADNKLSALLDGIEGLEKDLLGADWLTDSTEIAHDLKALREKANG